MNKPFFKSNLIDLQELDNKIYSLINKKLNGKLTTDLKNAEVQYKNILKEKEEVEKVLEPYLSELKVIETKETDIKNKISSIDQKLNNQKLNSDELSNYEKQKKNNENILLQIYESQENSKSKFLVEIDQLDTINFQLEDKKNELIKLSKLTQDEWKNIDQKLSLLEDDKKKFINTLPNEIVQLYDDLKSKGVEVIAGYKREGQCGCCGVSLTSSELDIIDDSEFNQCPYCQGVQV